MTIWRTKPSSVVTRDGEYLVLTHKVVFRTNSDGKVVWKKKHYKTQSAFMTYLQHLMFDDLQATKKEKETDMATTRWQPKPCLCFERKEHGRILVVGNKITQYDANDEVTANYEHTTFYDACQQALLMIGAMTID